MPPEDGQVMPKHVEALRFNKVKVNVKCIKLVSVIKLPCHIIIIVLFMTIEHGLKYNHYI
jgi:hypothetical protein